MASVFDSSPKGKGSSHSKFTPAITYHNQGCLFESDMVHFFNILFRKVANVAKHEQILYSSFLPPSSPLTRDKVHLSTSVHFLRGPRPG